MLSRSVEGRRCRCSPGVLHVHRMVMLGLLLPASSQSIATSCTLFLVYASTHRPATPPPVAIYVAAPR